MTRNPSFGQPAPMEGAGAYNRSSGVQAASLQVPLSKLERAAAAVPLPGRPTPIVVADYGASTGHNSLAPMKAAIRSLRQRVGSDRAISVVHTDLPDNDFTELFRTLCNDPDSYLTDDEAVFVSAVGRSFYQQILPPRSVALAWSSWAVQWLSYAPAQIPDHIQVAYSDDPGAGAAFARQARQDWRSFLLSRGQELCPGGRLVIVTMASSDEGDFGYRCVLDAMYSGLQELVKDGFLHPAEMRRMAIPTVGRTRAEFVEPFSANGQFGGLSLEDIEFFGGEDRIWTRFEGDGNAALFGASWAAFSRASVFPTLALGLGGDRNDPRSHDFMDKLEAAMATQLSLKPERATIPLVSLVLAKA